MRNIKSNPTKTVLTISTGLLIVYFITDYEILVKFSTALGIIAIISNFFSHLIEKIWFKLAELLSFIVPNIILTIVYYFFLFPVASIARLFNKNQIKRYSKNSNTSFISMEKTFKGQDFKNPW